MRTWSPRATVNGWYPKLSPAGTHVVYGFWEAHLANLETGIETRLLTPAGGARIHPLGWLDADTLLFGAESPAAIYRVPLALITPTNGAFTIPASCDLELEADDAVFNWGNARGGHWAIGNAIRPWVLKDGAPFQKNVPIGGRIPNQYGVFVAGDHLLTLDKDRSLLHFKGTTLVRELPQDNGFVVNEQGDVLTGYYGPVQAYPFGEAHVDATIVPWKLEGGPLPIRVNGALWIWTYAERAGEGLALGRILGEAGDPIVVHDTIGTTGDVVVRGEEFLLATYSDKGRLEVRWIPIATPREPIPSLPPAPMPAPNAPAGPVLFAGVFGAAADTPGNVCVLGGDPETVVVPAGKAIIATLEVADKVPADRLVGLFVAADGPKPWRPNAITLEECLELARPIAERLKVPTVVYDEELAYGRQYRAKYIAGLCQKTPWIAMPQWYVETRGREGESIDTFLVEIRAQLASLQAAAPGVRILPAVRVTTGSGAIAVDKVARALNALIPLTATIDGWLLFAWTRADGVTGTPALEPFARAWTLVPTTVPASGARAWAAKLFAPDPPAPTPVPPTPTPGPSPANGILRPGQRLRVDQPLRSANGRYTVLVQRDGNVAVYGPGFAASLFDGRLIGRGTASLDMQGDGHLVPYDAQGRVVLDAAGVPVVSGTNGHPGAWFILQDDRNCVIYDVDGRALWASGTTITGPEPPTPTPIPPTPGPVPGARSGIVRLQGHAFADAGGPWLSLGTTYFPALWLEKFDPARLDLNFAWMASHGIDYFRFLTMVGGASWEDRTIDPAWPDYWTVADRLIARAARHGLRMQATLFAEAGTMMPRQADRRAWVDQWGDRINLDLARFDTAETANEYWQNGLSLDELVELTARLRNRVGVLVLPSAAAGGTMPEGTSAEWLEELKEGTIDQGEFDRRVEVRAEWIALAGAADMMGPHFSRTVDTSDGYDRPVRQPWEMLFEPRGIGVDGYKNNEPIGNQSSGAQDDDPRRTALAAAVTWLAGGAAYTWHTGAGIRAGGAADVARGRAANLWELPNAEATLAEINRVRALLPANLPNGRPANAHWAEAPFQVDPEALVRCYQSIMPDGTIVALPHGIKGATVALVARRPVEINGRRLGAGERLVVDAPSAVLVGRLV